MPVPLPRIIRSDRYAIKRGLCHLGQEDHYTRQADDACRKQRIGRQHRQQANIGLRQPQHRIGAEGGDPSYGHEEARCTQQAGNETAQAITFALMRRRIRVAGWWRAPGTVGPRPRLLRLTFADGASAWIHLGLSCIVKAVSRYGRQ